MNLRTCIVVVALALVACGKDEPPAAPSSATAAPTTPAAPGAASTNTSAQQAGPGTPEPKPDIKPEPKPEPKPDLAPTPLPAPVMSPVPELAPLTGTTVATFPPDIVAVGGVKSLASMTEAVAASQGNPMAGALGLQMITERLKTALQIPTLGWLDANQPLRFAIPDPKKWPDGFVVLVPVVADASAKLEPSALGLEPKKDGHWGALVRGDRTLYFDRAPGSAPLLIVTSHVDLSRKLADLTTLLSAWVPTDLLVLEGSVANAKKIFAAELAQAQTMSTAALDKLREAGLAAQQLAAMKEIVSGALGLIDGLDRTSFTVDFGGPFPRAHIELRAADGTSLAKGFADLATRHPSLVSAVPAEAWLALAYDLDLGALMGTDTESITKSLTDGARPWSRENAEAFATHALELRRELPGAMAFWATTSGAFPLALEQVSRANDPMKARAALLSMLDATFRETWGKARQQLADGGVPADALPGLTFVELVRGVGQFGKALGISASLPQTPGADTLAFDIDWARFGGGRVPAALKNLVANMVGPRLELALAAGEGRLAWALGPSGASRAVTLLTAATTSDAWLDRAAKDSFVVLSFRPTRLLRALADAPQLASRREAIVKLPDDPLMLTAKAIDARLQLTLTVPRDLVTQLMSLR